MGFFKERKDAKHKIKANKSEIVALVSSAYEYFKSAHELGESASKADNKCRRELQDRQADREYNAKQKIAIAYFRVFKNGFEPDFVLATMNAVMNEKRSQALAYTDKNMAPDSQIVQLNAIKEKCKINEDQIISCLDGAKEEGLKAFNKHQEEVAEAKQRKEVQAVVDKARANIQDNAAQELNDKIKAKKEQTAKASEPTSPTA